MVIASNLPRRDVSPSTSPRPYARATLGCRCRASRVFPTDDLPQPGDQIGDRPIGDGIYTLHNTVRTVRRLDGMCRRGRGVRWCDQRNTGMIASPSDKVMVHGSHNTNKLRRRGASMIRGCVPRGRLPPLSATMKQHQQQQQQMMMMTTMMMAAAMTKRSTWRCMMIGPDNGSRPEFGKVTWGMKRQR
jgi:hypothetical protein